LASAKTEHVVLREGGSRELSLEIADSRRIRIQNKMPIGIAALKAAGVDTSALKLDIIKEVKAREILDSRGNPTIEVRRPSSIRELKGPLRRLHVQFRVQQG
jgi:hypothetical protein